MYKHLPLIMSFIVNVIIQTGILYGDPACPNRPPLTAFSFNWNRMLLAMMATPLVALSIGSANIQEDKLRHRRL
jgi:hypothetical protein